MNKRLMIPLIVLLLASMACSTRLPFMPAPTAEVFATLPPMTPTSPPATVTPTAEPALMEEFNLITSDWSEAHIITTQAIKGRIYSKLEWKDGTLKFNLQDKETYMYSFFQKPTTPNVVMETNVIPTGNVYYGIALVCRAKPDLSEWYEFRVNGTLEYSVYYFNRARRDVDEKNPYIELDHGITDATRPLKKNFIRATCNGPNLILEINEVEVSNINDVTLTEGGLVGLGAMSSEILPAVLNFEYLLVRRP